MAQMAVFKILVVAGASTSIAGCSDSCANTVVRVIKAPGGGAHAGVLFQRDCGATTAFSTHVSVLRRGEELEGAGNVFISDGGGAAPVTQWGGPWAEMRWLAPDHLQISYDAEARVFEQARKLGDVRVSYRKIPPAK